MADNFTTDPGAGGATFAADDIGGVHYPYVKLAFGANNTATLVSGSDPLPVIGASNSGVDIGDVTINNATGASSVPSQGAAAHDAAAAGNPLLIGGYAKAAAPSDVSADADAVRAWYLLNGAAATVLTAAGALIGGDATNGLDVDVTRSALPSGASTSAKQDTVIGHLDGVEGLLGTIDADTGNISTKIDTLAGAVSGTEFQVDVLTMPTTTVQATNLDIRDLTSASDSVAAAQSGAWTVRISDGTDTADVLDLTNANPLAVAILDGDGTQISSFGGGTQYTEDAVAAANPVGTAPILIRADTPGTITNTDGDNVAQRGTNYGAAYVQVVDSAGNYIDTFGGSGGTAAADDADFSAGTTQGTPAMGVFESSPTSVTDGDMGIVGITAARRLKTSTTIDAAIPAGTNNIGDVDVLSVVPGTGATALGKAIDTALGATDTGVLALTVRDDTLATLTEADGDVSALRVDSTGRLWANVSNTVTVSGTVTAAQGTAANLNMTEASAASSLTALQLIDDIVYTDDTSTHATGTSKGALFMAAAVPTDTSVSANDIGALAMTTDRKLHVAVMDALPAGTAAIGKLAANSGVDIGDVDVTSISAGTNTIGNVGLIGRTSGGLTMFSSIDLDESEEEVKATAGQIFSIAAFNRTAAPLYLKLYNLTAANTTVGSSAISATFVVPANADSDGAGFIWNNEIGLAFSTAISAAVTTGVAANDTGAPGANDCVCFIGYI